MTKLNTPWGIADSVTEIAPGILSVSTPSHGGIKLDEARWAQVPTLVRTTPYSRGGFYEEDCDWAIPRLVFDAEFSAWELANGRNPDEVRAAARNTLTCAYEGRYAGVVS